MKQTRPFPQLVVTRKAVRSISAGHPWVFESEVLRLAPAPTDGCEAQNGDIVDVIEENGTWQGAALLSHKSVIRARIVSRNANDSFDEDFWRRRIFWAWQHRMTTLGAHSRPGQEDDTTCCRVLFSEADGVPGLTIDKYEDVLVAQVGTVGMERLRSIIYPIVLDVLDSSGYTITAIYERNDGGVRAKEGLPLYKGWWNTTSSKGAKILVRENGLRFELDLENSQKTGFFLDQKYNRRAVSALARGRRVLDCFCHVGPFGLGAIQGGASYARLVDASQTALDLARANAGLNGFSVTGNEAQVGFTRADALEYLPSLRNKATLRAEGGPFDLIILDPPAFAKTRTSVRHATKGYRDINASAMRILPRGGYLATCSCSHYMTTDLLRQALADAAHIANRQLKQVEERQQAPDHPILWGFPQSHYLDFFIFQVI